MSHREGTVIGQDPRQASPGAGSSVRSTHASTLRRLLNDRQARELVGVGERKWAEILAEKPDWLPLCIQLGPRLRRWDADELIEAIRTRAPRGTKNPEPAQLRRARIDRMKAGGAGQEVKE